MASTTISTSNFAVAGTYSLCLKPKIFYVVLSNVFSIKRIPCWRLTNRFCWGHLHLSMESNTKIKKINKHFELKKNPPIFRFCALSTITRINQNDYDVKNKLFCKKGLNLLYRTVKKGKFKISHWYTSISNEY